MSPKFIFVAKRVLLPIFVVLIFVAGVVSWRHRSILNSKPVSKVVHDGDKLTFRTAKGDRVLVNSSGASAVKYTVKSYIDSLDAFHLLIREGEPGISRNALLLLATDQLVDLPGRPLWNRDSTRFAAIGNGFESGTDPTPRNAASLWSASTLGCRLELDVLSSLNLPTSEWGATEASWETDNLVRIKLVKRREDPTREWKYASFDCRLSTNWQCLPTQDPNPRPDDPEERKFIAESGGVIVRDGDKLEFRTEKGARIFQDVYDPHGDQGMIHRVVKSIGPVDAYQIHVAYLEGSSDLLLFLANNQTVTLPSGDLTWNSSFTGFLLTYQDFESEYVGNLASLWSASRFGAKKDFDLLETLKPQTASWGGAGGKWIDDTHVVVDLVEPFSERAEDGLSKSGKKHFSADCRHDREWKCVMGEVRKVYD